MKKLIEKGGVTVRIVQRFGGFEVEHEGQVLRHLPGYGTKVEKAAVRSAHYYAARLLAAREEG